MRGRIVSGMGVIPRFPITVPWVFPACVLFHVPLSHRIQSVTKIPYRVSNENKKCSCLLICRVSKSAKGFFGCNSRRWFRQTRAGFKEELTDHTSSSGWSERPPTPGVTKHPAGQGMALGSAAPQPLPLPGLPSCRLLPSAASSGHWPRGPPLQRSPSQAGAWPAALRQELLVCWPVGAASSFRKLSRGTSSCLQPSF